MSYNDSQGGATAEDVLNAAVEDNVEEQRETSWGAQTEGEGQPTSEYEASEEQPLGQQESPAVEVSLAPTMSPEETLLLQVLRRSKRQQDLIMKVQKSLKVLANIEKTANRTSEQIKQLQSAAKESQRQFTKTQRQISSVEKRVQRLATSKVAPKTRNKSNKSNKKRKKGKSRAKRR